jgi:hypothetical protein
MYKARMNQYVKLILLINEEISVAKHFKTVITESQNNDDTSKNVDENSAYEVISSLFCLEV